MINTSRSERGWRGRRRIAVLVSIAGVLGIAALGSASTASAVDRGQLQGQAEPEGHVRDVGEAELRLDSTDSRLHHWRNKKIKNYAAPERGRRQLAS